jgi:hypothetical protein
MKIAFEWGIADPDPPQFGQKVVVERLPGTNHQNIFGPMPTRIAESFIKARQQMVDRNIKNNFQAVQLFEKRPELIDLAKRLQTKYENED